MTPSCARLVTQLTGFAAQLRHLISALQMNLPPLSQASTYPSHGANDYQSTAAAALSQQHTLAPNGNGRKRRASGVPGSRGVANLTPEQLAKKRANDREAQRAIRERTRNTIESLERRIQELESQQPFQELQKVAQERDRALQECEDLRRKLATVASVVGTSQQQQQQPNLHGTCDVFEQFIDPTWLTEGGAELAALTAQQSPLPPLNTSMQPQTYPTSAGAAELSPYEERHLHPDLRSPQTSTHASPLTQTVMTGPGYQADDTALRRWSTSLEHPPMSQYPPTNGVSYEQRLPPPPQMPQPQSNGERLGLNYVLGPQQQSPVKPLTAQRPPPPSEEPIYARLPLNMPPTSPLDSLLLDFLNSCRQQIAAGVSTRDVAGPQYPSLVALHDPNVARNNVACHPLSALLIDILSKFPAISQLPERVAVLYIMFLIVRWQICPCEPCYQRLPDWMKPTKEQLETSHPAWCDHVPW